MSGYICSILLLFLHISKSWGGEICLSKDHTGTPKYCEDTYYKVSFCCLKVDGYFTACCTYTKVWALWYFWFTLCLSFVLLGACIGGIIRYKKRNSNKSDSGSEVSMEEEQRVVFVTTQPAQTLVQQQPPIDAPPPYQLPTEDQAVMSQANEMDRYEPHADQKN